MPIEGTEEPLGTKVHTCRHCKRPYYVSIDPEQEREQVKAHIAECLDYPFRYLHTTS